MEESILKKILNDALDKKLKPIHNEIKDMKSKLEKLEKLEKDFSILEIMSGKNFTDIAILKTLK